MSHSSDLTQLRMQMFAELSVNTSSVSFKQALATGCTDCNPPAAARPAAFCLFAGEGNDVLRRAAIVDGVGTKLFNGR